MKRFDVEVAFETEGSRGWRVVAEDVEAEYARDALEQVLGSEDWKPPHAYGTLRVARGGITLGQYRVVERNVPHPWVYLFSVDGRLVLDIAEAVPEPESIAA